MSLAKLVGGARVGVNCGMCLTTGAIFSNFSNRKVVYSIFADVKSLLLESRSGSCS